jgi:nicotinamide phosphoribosyltransferase
MLAPGTDYLYGTWIPRSTKHAPRGIGKIVSFGQQLTVKWINDEFQENFFNLPFDEAMKFINTMSLYLGMDYDGDHFKDLHRLGYLPIRVKALTEGIETAPNVPHMTFINTKKGYAWLTLFLETIFSSLAWKPSTSATIALKYNRNATHWVNKTDKENAWLIPYLCHDFSARGLDPWSMVSSGLGHATSFRGSDTLVVIPGAHYFYGEPENEVCINSVNASEHSVSTTNIFTMGESEMIKYFMDQFPSGILSIVADTFDLWKLITEYLVENKNQITSRDGKLVVRPDSGNPVDIICGIQIEDFTNKASTLEEAKLYAKECFVEQESDETPHGECGNSDISGIFKYDNKYYQLDIEIMWNRYDKQYYFMDGEEIKSCKEVDAKPEYKGVIELLWDIFGGTTNDQGYKVLDPHIGAIYGDSITTDRQIQIYQRLADKGFAATNIVLGVGSYTYQYNTRDTFGFAAKGAWFETNNQAFNIYKDPITDDGTKKSLKGLCAVFEDANGDYTVKTECDQATENTGELKTIFEDGKLYNPITLTDIRGKISNLVEKDLVKA